MGDFMGVRVFDAVPLGGIPLLSLHSPRRASGGLFGGRGVAPTGYSRSTGLWASTRENSRTLLRRGV